MQSKHAKLGVDPTNGDGFGVGWYGTSELPGVYKSTEPAWHDRNMRELAAFAKSPRVFAHVRASTGTPVQQSNCHPFRNGRWLWMHNGSISGFHEMKRDLVFAVDPELYPDIEGSTDSEVLFYLALSQGLHEDPPGAVARAVGIVEATAKQHGVQDPMQMTVATSDGETTWAFRYSTVGDSRTLFHSTDISTLRAQYPDNPNLHKLSDDARLIVSEPLGDLKGAWHEVPESTCLTIRGGVMTKTPFAPLAPSPSGTGATRARPAQKSMRT